jgi:hypothetical protein
MADRIRKLNELMRRWITYSATASALSELPYVERYVRWSEGEDGLTVPLLDHVSGLSARLFPRYRYP